MSGDRRRQARRRRSVTMPRDARLAPAEHLMTRARQAEQSLGLGTVIFSDKICWFASQPHATLHDLGSILVTFRHSCTGLLLCALRQSLRKEGKHCLNQNTALHPSHLHARFGIAALQQAKAEEPRRP